jgi:glycosyltransferase involved in cell wall biosynthesis
MNTSTEIACSEGILQIHWCFPPTTGGVESHVADLAAAMARKGCRVVVLTGERNPIRCDLYEIVSTDLLNLEMIKTASLPRREFLTQFSKLLVQLISRYQISTIHGHNLHHFHSAPALVVETMRRQLGLRVFHTFHETWPNLLQENPVYQLWNGNYAASRHVQEQCKVVLGFSPALYPFGVNISVFKSSTECFTSGQPPVILHPARLLPWKGVDISIHALRLLVDRGYQIMLVITDTQRIADWNSELSAYRKRIMGLIGELQLSGYIRFERASYTDMPLLYEKADVVVYPTIGEEPYGLVPIEAMSCARPIVASNSGGIPETVVDGITGYIVPRGDASALANRLAELISNQQLARSLGAAGRRRAADSFDADRYVSILLEHFAQA